MPKDTKEKNKLNALYEFVGNLMAGKLRDTAQARQVSAIAKDVENPQNYNVGNFVNKEPVVQAPPELPAMTADQINDLIKASQVGQPGDFRTGGQDYSWAVLPSTAPYGEPWMEDMAKRVPNAKYKPVKRT